MTSKQLRDSILQAAIQGQLVSQEPSDTPAALLLERIQAERERLIKERKIRRDKNASVIYRTDEGSYYERNLTSSEETCIDDEIPFDIPDSWQWTRLGCIGDWGAGATPAKGNLEYYNGGTMLWLRTGELNNGVVYDTEIKITEKALQECSLRLNKVGDVMIAMYGATIGKLAIAGAEMTTNQACCACTPIKVSNWYLFYFLMASKTDFIKKGAGGAQPNISREKLTTHLFPIPPLEEQERIVARIEELMTLVDQYDQAKVALDELESTLPDMLQQSILQAAIQGQLVPQVPSDTPAARLLERIQAEQERLIKEKKIRRDKNASVIYRTDEGSYYERNLASGEETCIDDEIPFDIPDSWQWSKIGDVFQHNNGKQLNKGKSSGVLMDYITTSNLYWDGFILEDLKQMPFESNEIDRCQALKGDLLVCEGGDIGRACIWNYDFPIMLQNHIHKLRAYIPICTEYVYYIFYLYNRMGLIGGKGIGIKGYSSKALHNTLIPIPPLEEQERIVARIEELMRYTDRLKSFTTPY